MPSPTNPSWVGDEGYYSGEKALTGVQSDGGFFLSGLRDTAGAMSEEENVEIVRRAYDAFNARDTAAFLSMCDPEVELRSALEQKTYRGLEEMLRWREDVVAVMEDFHREDIRFVGNACSCSIEWLDAGREAASR